MTILHALGWGLLTFIGWLVLMALAYGDLAELEHTLPERLK